MLVLCVVLAAMYAVVLALPSTRGFFALTVPGPEAVAAALIGTAIAIAGLALTDERFLPLTRAA
jgi:hypothetical protein